MKSKLLILLSFFFIPLFGDEIQISLPTKDKISKVYFASAGNDLVDQIFSEDFKLDGRGVVFAKRNDLESIKRIPSSDYFKSALWKANKIDYVIKPSYKNKALNVEIFDVRKQTVKVLNAIKLDQGRNKSIHTLHSISDFLMKEIHGEPGIASKRILFSYRPFQKDATDNLVNWHAEIYETDTLGLYQKQVTFENSYCINPEFTTKTNQNGDYEFVYVTYKQGMPQIYLGRPGITSKGALIKLRGNQLLPRMSYDGKYLAFISDASGKSDVFVQKMKSDNHVHGKPIQVYSGASQTSASPSLSPDNKSIAFVSDKTGIAKIYIADISGTLSSHKTPPLTRIKSPCSECTAPSYSPDGSKIVFSGKINGRRQIWLYDIRQKTTHQLTSGPEDKENPCFGRNNRHIVYNTTSPTIDLFLLDCESKKIRRLTKGTGDKHYPAFEK